jgi:tRNA 5-methylaminomethyl-2-thiouridine biosynthesis bifunctional protein
MIERRPHPASRASSGFAGVFQPHVSRDDCILSRIARNGYLYAVSRWEALRGHIRGSAWERCGVLQLPRQFDEEPWMRETLAALDHPLDYVEYVEKDRAEALSGSHLHSGGWWFPGAGWARPSALIAAQIAGADARQATGASLTTHFDVTGQTIARGGDGWQAFAIDGSLIATAPVLILANAHDVTRLASLGHPLKRIRGQVTYVPAESCAPPHIVLTGTGYVLPAACGVVLVGSTYDYDEDPVPRVSGHEANLDRVSRFLPNALDESIAAANLDGAVGFRCVAADRMPVVGVMPDIDEARERREELRGAHLPDLPRQSGLYCASGFASRGLIWAELAGEMLGSLLEGEPSPLENDLAAAVDPGRFLLRQLRQRSL